MNARYLSRLICLLFIMTGASAWAAPRVKVLKLSITNPTDETRLHENIVLSVAKLKRIAPDFKAGDMVVTTSDASTLAEDGQTLQTIELPSQADDLDGDNNYDEIAFQIELKPRQTRIVTIAYQCPGGLADENISAGNGRHGLRTWGARSDPSAPGL